MAVFDWVGSLVAGAVVGRWWGVAGVLGWALFLVGWVVFGVVVHWLIGVPTMLGWQLGLSAYPWGSSSSELVDKSSAWSSNSLVA